MPKKIKIRPEKIPIKKGDIIFGYEVTGDSQGRADAWTLILRNKEYGEAVPLLKIHYACNEVNKVAGYSLNDEKNFHPLKPAFNTFFRLLNDNFCPDFSKTPTDIVADYVSALNPAERLTWGGVISDRAYATLLYLISDSFYSNPK